MTKKKIIYVSSLYKLNETVKVDNVFALWGPKIRQFSHSPELSSTAVQILNNADMVISS